ncbi:uncharacterized protein LOC128753631 isoform X1 [Synchiropus splendidus]|uniref:uncharacterized protein LOC128753631 isoform X1 n=1 Tax=Synchiropus splendidus TaxID=270530 RepID=UPI00237E3E03|nr:uncharacterized protein LOC128753631 isoform X1 [Synchiropus splendidus]
MDLVSKPRGKSLVWLYFGLKADERGRPLNSGEAICRLCRKIVLAKGGNTTNLRSHLKRRHRADFFEGSLSTTPGALLDTHGLDLNSEDYFEDTSLLQPVSNQNYVPDAVLPPGEPWLHGGPSRAVLSLPSCLGLCGVQGSGTSAAGPSCVEQMQEIKVFAKCHLQQGVIFGPYIGEVCRTQMPSCLKYAWAIRDDASFVYVDASDEDKSNWMRFVSYTSSEEDQNLVVFQFYRRIYYRVSQPIAEGTQLRVWIGKDYASLLGLGMGENVKCELGDKESVLRLLQDIQLITLPEPSSSSLWSDCSQSQSPMPVISEVSTMSNSETIIDSTNISALVSSSHLPSLTSHPSDKYDFMPGTEKLVSTNARANSCWYFVGFEPDPAGRPLDHSLVVCKLCGDHLSCTKGADDIQNHLIAKHQIRTQNSVREPSQAKGQQRMLSNPGALMTQTILLPANVTDAIANFLIQDLHPVGLVEGEGFKQLINTLLPSYYKLLPLPSLLEVLLREHHVKGKTGLAQLLKRRSDSREVNIMLDHTAPIEDEPRRPASVRDVPHSVTLSVDIWNHNWQGKVVKYLSLWAHFIDPCFSCQNLTLSTQQLNDCTVSLEAVEAQVKVMAQEWGISQPSLIVVGGEGRNKMQFRSIKMEKGNEAAESIPHPNSTTFLERDDSRTPDEQSCHEPGQSSEALPSVPCFYSATQNCIDEVMTHPVISSTLAHFQGLLSTFVQLSSQFIGFYPHNFQNLLPMLTKHEHAELFSWAHSQPTWNNLFPVLSTVTKHRTSICDAVKEIEGFAKDNWESTSSNSHFSSSIMPSGLVPPRSEWKILEDLCLILKPLDVACRTLAKEDHPRLCLLKPILTGLLSRHLVSRSGDSSPLMKEVKSTIRQKLTSCYNHPEINRVLCVACALDPQFHGLLFMEEREQKETFEWLKKEAVRIVREQHVRQKNKIQRKRSSSPESESDSDPLRRSKRLKHCSPIGVKVVEELYDDSDPGQADDSDYESTSQTGLSGMEFLLGDLFSSTPKRRENSVEESVDMEISVFRADKGASLGVEPVQWWRTKAAQFPILAKVARVFLAAPAVISNTAHYFLQNAPGASSFRRDNIPPEMLDTILFLHHNHMTVEGGQLALKNEERL